MWGGGQQGQCSLPGPREQEGFPLQSPQALLQSSELQAPSLLSAQGQGKLQTWHSEEGGQETGSRVGRRRDGGGVASREKGGVQTEGEGRIELQWPGGLEDQGQKELREPATSAGGHGGLERARGLLKATVLVPSRRRVPGSWLQTLQEGEKGPRGRVERLTQGRRLGAAHRPSQGVLGASLEQRGLS